MKEKLVFVYNADSGLFNTVSDIAHKIFSPDTYQCRLCEITHSYFTMRDEWNDAMHSLPVKCEFMHRDDFMEKYRFTGKTFPAIYLYNKDQLEEFISAKEINTCNSIEELKNLINDHLKQK